MLKAVTVEDTSLKGDIPARTMLAENGTNCSYQLVVTKQSLKAG